MTRYYEFGAGLGDVINRCCRERYFDSLDNITEEVDVVVCSHNPYSSELFSWHPKRHLMNVRCLPYWLPSNDESVRSAYNLPRVPGLPGYSSQDGMRYWISPDDDRAMANLPQRFAVIAPSAGLPSRDIPDDIVLRVCRDLVSCGITPVFCGRSFIRSGRAESFAGRDVPGCINLIDRLTVPGVGELVNRCEAVVACHSAVNIMAWYAKKPQLLLYPEAVRQYHFMKEDDWSFGMNFPGTFQATLEAVEGVEVAIGNFLVFLGKNRDMQMPVCQLDYPAEASEIRLHWPGGRFTLDRDVRLLIHYIKNHPGNILEIGCHRGVTTLELAMAFPERIIYAVDYPWSISCSQQDWERVQPHEFCEFSRMRHNVVPIMKSIEDIPLSVFQNVGIVFVDGGLWFHGVHRDTAIADKLGASLIAWHDCYDGAPAWVGVLPLVEMRAKVNPDGVFRVKDSWMAFEDRSAFRAKATGSHGV